MKKKLFNAIILIATLLLVLYFSLKNDFTKTITQIFTANVWWILVAFLLIIFYWFFKSLSVYEFMKQSSGKCRFRQAFMLILRTQFFNAITPFATGGQPYQVYYLKRTGISLASSTGIIVENFIVYQIALVFLGIVAIISNYFFHFFDKVILLEKLVTLGFIINTLVIVVLFVVSFAKKLDKKIINFGITILTKLKLVKDKEKKLNSWNDYINQFHKSAAILLNHKKTFAKTIIYNLIGLCILYLIPVVILYSMGDFTSFNGIEAIITSAYVMLIGSFVPIPGGSGGLEYGFIAFYGNFVSGSMLSAIMLIWRFVTYYFGMIVGAIALNIKKVK